MIFAEAVDFQTRFLRDGIGDAYGLVFGLSQGDVSQGNQQIEHARTREI